MDTLKGSLAFVFFIFTLMIFGGIVNGDKTDPASYVIDASEAVSGNLSEEITCLSLNEPFIYHGWDGTFEITIGDEAEFKQEMYSEYKFISLPIQVKNVGEHIGSIEHNEVKFANEHYDWMQTRHMIMLYMDEYNSSFTNREIEPNETLHATIRFPDMGSNTYNIIFGNSDTGRIVFDI